MNIRIVYLIELINCFAAVYYSNFIYFYMKSRFGFGELENLLLAALNGLIYMIASRKGGQFAQRFGYLRSIFIGSFGLCGDLVGGEHGFQIIQAQVVRDSRMISIRQALPAREDVIVQ